jgi:cytochrome b subunit of formate dehydrogenase
LNRFIFYKKVSRWSLVALVVVGFLSLISGFGLTNPLVTFRLTFGLLDRSLSYELHVVWTPLLLLVFAWLHVFPRLVIESKRIRVRRPELLEALILAVGIVTFVYFYVLSIPFRA